MFYGRCTKCHHEVTIGGDKCAFCGEPLPLITSPGDDQGAPAAKAQPTLRSVYVGPDEIAPTAALTAEQLASVGVDLAEEVGHHTDPQVTADVPAPQHRSTTAIDMRHLLDDGSASPSEIAAPVRVRAGAVNYPSTTLSETDVEGLEPVHIARSATAGSRDVQSRHAILRVWPLLVVTFVGVSALAFAGWQIVDDDADEGGTAALDAKVELEAGEFAVGLTEENKNTVLQMCYRVSTNPNYQCRQSNYEALGEFPQRTVHFEPLSIDVYEVSNRRYDACVEAGICEPRDISSCRFFTHRALQINAAPPDRMLDVDYPAICVARDEAEEFCRWTGGRLPTPDEWEIAARSGDDRLAPWGTLWAPDLINWAETEMGGFPVVGHLDGYDLSAPVDHFENGATPNGLYNMLGNVAEWVAADPDRPDGVRGGSYRDDLRDLRLTRRWDVDPDDRRSDVGFRCVYDVTE